MRFHYYPETDSLYIELSENPSADSSVIAPGVVLDFDESARLVVDLSTLEATALPIRALAVA
jgi:uncharacterized protein YuzE